jgi:hypothetical protein
MVGCYQARRAGFKRDTVKRREAFAERDLGEDRTDERLYPRTLA